VVKIPHYTEYKCGKCGRTCERDLLITKKVVFQKLGPGGKIIKSRTKLWLCDECLPEDEDFNTEPYTAAPGTKSAPLERVRELESREVSGTAASAGV
jgi:hypothetical protein